jgi:hypothetical protein
VFFLALGNKGFLSPIKEAFETLLPKNLNSYKTTMLKIKTLKRKPTIKESIERMTITGIKSKRRDKLSIMADI